MKIALAAIIAVMAGTLPALALDGPGRALVASNTVQITDDRVQNGTSLSTRFIPPYSGTVRVKWEIKSKDGTEGFIDVDVTHVGNCSTSTTSTTYVSQSCDIRVMGGYPLNVRSNTDDGHKLSLKNVSLSYEVVTFDGQAVVYDFADDD